MPATPTEPSTDLSKKKSSQIVIHIDILPDDISCLDSLPDLPLLSGFDNFPTLACDDVVRVSQQPRPLRSIDPTVTFLSDVPIMAKSTFTVVSSGMTVFSEVTTLTSAGQAPNSTGGALLYSTTLVPGYWQKITESSGMCLVFFCFLLQCLTTCVDPTQYTITQDVVKDDSSSPVTMFSAVYKFTYRSKESEWPDSPAPSSGGSDQSSDDTSTTGSTIQASVPFDNLIPMDQVSFMDYEDLDTYFDFTSMDVKPTWDYLSSSAYPNDMSSGYDHLSVSPTDTCFQTDLYNYASRLICLLHIASFADFLF